MTTLQEKVEFIIRPAKTISNGFSVCNDAFLSADESVDGKFLFHLKKYMDEGHIKLHTARLGIKNERPKK